ncbi:hypothetical protein [Asticcacaulis sp.]|uniref:hypothetical protein n=1 Tax=Asticcacaulis sp. TaxID=1872648 RepID=UPI003F7C1A7A
MDELGYIGEERPLLIRKGAPLGPYAATLTDANGQPVNLTNCTIPWVIKKYWKDAEPVASGVFEVTDGASGQYTVFIDHQDTDVLFAGGTLNEPASMGHWQADVVDAANVPQPLYYGQVRVQRDLMP